MKKKIVIGVLTTPGDNDLFRPLFKENKSLGNVLYLFSLQDIKFKKRKIKGYLLTPDGRWEQRRFKWPDAVIDKYFDTSHKLYEDIRKHDLLPFTEHQLPGKWELHNILWKVPSLRPFLPVTCTYSPHALKKMLRRFPLLYIKPFDGTWGNGIVKIERHTDGFLAVGRKRKKKIQEFIPQSEIIPWIDRWVDRIPFVIQQGLHLNLLKDRVADMRILIQKNEKGKWQITGQGMRIGAPKSPVSNLHGGGAGKEVFPVLQSIFGIKKVKNLLRKCHEISYLVADTIEQKYGRMMELGLDIGIDNQGQIWIIEVNDKPGRKIFKQMGRHDLFRQANRQPLLYASYLVRAGQNRRN
ncbi:YheC/YheD family protein [Ammoniphilus sp. 3BR4]|uniref:YheC/YheD family endospore coat-associated protein n=1 Tax=Ammoniphilus sp. 3BR4 TaxID=3158265 RepID=UPI0034674CA5